MKKEVKVVNEIKESILARLGTMDAEDLEKVLGFLKELEKQKEQKQGVD